MTKPAVRRIDFHHHFFPSSIEKIKKNAEMGWRTPEENLPWTPEVSLRFMDALQVDTAILSLPPCSTGSIGLENRHTARRHNVFAADLCRKYPGRFGFFASLPFLDDIEGALSEIAYAYDELNADGIALTSLCEDGDNARYIAHDRYDPIWAELDRRNAVVFLHGAQVGCSRPYPHAYLSTPVTEVPHETFKAAAHLVVSGKKRKYFNVKILLAHLGGSTPFLAARVAVLAKHMGCTLSHDEILQDFKSFYYETALSAYEPTLAALIRFVPPDRILFGTDFPAVSKDMIKWYTDHLERFYDKDSDALGRVLNGNALQLLPALRRLPSNPRMPRELTTDQAAMKPRL